MTLVDFFQRTFCDVKGNPDGKLLTLFGLSGVIVCSYPIGWIWGRWLPQPRPPRRRLEQRGRQRSLREPQPEQPLEPEQQPRPPSRQGVDPARSRRSRGQKLRTAVPCK